MAENLIEVQVGDKIIHKNDFETAFEHATLGGSSRSKHAKSDRDDHIPAGVLDGEITIEEAQEARAQAYFYINPHLAALLGTGTWLAISREPLDPKTGETIRDPKVLGTWETVSDKYHGEIKPVEGRDLTEEFYQLLREAEKRDPEHVHYSLRESTHTREGRNPHLETE